MGSNLPVESKQGIFTKIVNFFRNKFKSNKISNVDNENIKVDNEEIDNLRNNLKVEEANDLDYIQNMNKEQFIEQLEKEPKLLEKLSVKQLKILHEYYQQIIKEYKLKLKT